MTTFQIDFSALEPRPKGGRPDRYNDTPSASTSSIMQAPITLDGIANLHVAFKDQALMKRISEAMQDNGMYFTSLATVVEHTGEGDDMRSTTQIVVTGEKFQPVGM